LRPAPELVPWYLSPAFCMGKQYSAAVANKSGRTGFFHTKFPYATLLRGGWGLPLKRGDGRTIQWHDAPSL